MVFKSLFLITQKNFAKNGFVIKPGTDAISGHGQFHVVPFSHLHASLAMGCLFLVVATDLFNNVLGVFTAAKVNLTVVLLVYIVEDDDESLRATVLTGSTRDGIVVRWNDVVANGQRSLFAGFMLQYAVIHLPCTPYQLWLTGFWQRIGVSIAYLRFPSGIAHTVLTGRDIVFLLRTSREYPYEKNGEYERYFLHFTGFSSLFRQGGRQPRSLQDGVPGRHL